jgi:hypothetical protein
MPIHPSGSPDDLSKRAIKRLGNFVQFVLATVLLVSWPRFLWTSQPFRLLPKHQRLGIALRLDDLVAIDIDEDDEARAEGSDRKGRSGSRRDAEASSCSGTFVVGLPQASVPSARANKHASVACTAEAVLFFSASSGSLGR